jgi:hypothetical protein
MIMVFASLAPQIALRLGLSPTMGMWLLSAPMFMRSIAFLVFWKWTGWHYHRGWSQAALWAAPVALAAIFFGRHWSIVAPALLLFGATVGLTYSGSLYYSWIMARPRASTAACTRPLWARYLSGSFDRCRHLTRDGQHASRGTGDSRYRRHLQSDS